MADKNKVKKLLVVRRRKFVSPGLLLGLFLLFLLLFVLLKIVSPSLFDNFNIWKSQSIVVAKVNGVNIYQSDIDMTVKRVSIRYGNISEEEALNQVIDEFLLIGEASRLNITLPIDYGIKTIEDYKNSTNASEEDMLLFWQKQGIDPKYASIYIERRALVELVINKSISSHIVVTNSDVAQFKGALIAAIKDGSSTITEVPSDNELAGQIYKERLAYGLSVYLRDLSKSSEIEIIKN